MNRQNRTTLDPARAMIRASAAMATAIRKSRLATWPARLLGPRPNLKEINLLCWGLFFGFVVVPVSYIFWLHLRAGQIGDFVYFYGIGHIANENAPVRLYDYSVQVKAFNAISPLHTGDLWGPCPYPPLVARFFSLFARLPFKLAFILWVIISLALYITGIAAVVKDAFPSDRLKASVIFCFAFAFPPFLLGTLINGQLCSIAVCCIGLAIYEERRSKPFVSGLILSVLTYKPTLLLLLLPMLVLRRRFRALFGFLTGAAIVFGASTALDGLEIWPAYLRFLSFFSGVLGIKEMAPFRHWQFLDLRALSLAIPGARSPLALTILFGFMIVVAAWLAVLSWKSAAHEGPPADLVSAATLTWTLLLNVYVPMYDAPLVVLTVVLTLGALRGLQWSDALGWIVFLAVLIFAISWNTESIAQKYGVQPLTALLVVLGLGQLLLLDRAIRPRALRQESEIPAA